MIWIVYNENTVDVRDLSGGKTYVIDSLNWLNNISRVPVLEVRENIGDQRVLKTCRTVTPTFKKAHSHTSDEQLYRLGLWRLYF